MISVMDVKRSFNISLKELTGIGVYSHSIDEGIKKPSFFTDINVIKSEAVNKHLHRYNLRIRALYYPEEKKIADMYVMQKILEDEYRLSLKVGNRVLNVNDIDFDIDEEEGYMYFTFTTVFFNRYKQEEVDTMRELVINEREV